MFLGKMVLLKNGYLIEIFNMKKLNANVITDIVLLVLLLVLVVSSGFILFDHCKRIHDYYKQFENVMSVYYDDITFNFFTQKVSNSISEEDAILLAKDIDKLKATVTIPNAQIEAKSMVDFGNVILNYTDWSDASELKSALVMNISILKHQALPIVTMLYTMLFVSFTILIFIDLYYFVTKYYS